MSSDHSETFSCQKGQNLLYHAPGVLRLVENTLVLTSAEDVVETYEPKTQCRYSLRQRCIYALVALRLKCSIKPLLMPTFIISRSCPMLYTMAFVFTTIQIMCWTRHIVHRYIVLDHVRTPVGWITMYAT